MTRTASVFAPPARLPASAVFVIQVLVVICPLLLWVLVRTRAPWGDEEHFLGTVRLFGAGVSLELLRAYPEMSAPLTYLVYAAWGQLVGFGTPELRLLSPLIASASALTWFAFLRDHIRSAGLLLAGFSTLVANPYFVGLSVFVFTDMLAILGLALSSLGLGRRRPLLVAVGVATATCSRQYLAFMVPALLIVALAYRRDRAHAIRLTLATLVGAVPIALLVLLWGGDLAPMNEIRAGYLAEGVRFDVHALSLYLSVPALYLVPLLVAGRSTNLRMAWLAGAALAMLVLFAPVQPSAAQLREGALTVGFVHRALATLLPASGVALCLAAMAAVNGATVVAAGRTALRRWSAGAVAPSELFMWVASGAFLAVMPFSYLPWEKYALPLLMTQGAALAFSSGTATAVEVSPQLPPAEPRGRH